jgi:rod shape-determining protein MreD
MKARMLKLLNLPGMILFALVSLSLQGTLFNQPSLAFFQPDMILFLVLWAAMKREFLEGGILTLLFGYLVEIKSGAPQGLFLCTYMALFLFARFLYRNFQVLNRRSLVLVGIGAALMSQLMILLILSLLDKADNQWFHTLQLLAPTAITHGLFIPFVFRFLHRFDARTLKSPDAEYRYERDFHLDEEPI